MVRCLTNVIYEDPAIDPWAGNKFILDNRISGTDWPSVAHTMIGVNKLFNLRELAEIVIRDKIPGDFIECGVWRGGATIFMRAILKAYNITDKNVWVADSFEGLPKPNTELYPSDKGDIHHTHEQLAVSIEQVQNNFMKYDLLDNQVKFLKGFFKDTLPTAPIEKLSLLRLDGDMYESTINCLDNLYPKLSKGGFVIFDDAFAVLACGKAMVDYREKHNITSPIYKLSKESYDGLAYWRK